jgi:hypothetical protein
VKVIEVHEYKFPTHLLPALVNNEPVDEDDRVCFNEFIDRLEQFKKFYRATDYAIEYETVSYFSWTNCLGNSFGCDVVDIRVHFIR